MAERELLIKVIAMPSDTNPAGEIFGGWLVSQMDLAAYLYARRLSSTKIVTAAIDNIVFHRPVFVGDCLMCYAIIGKMGCTSVAIRVEALVERIEDHIVEQVAEGHFVLVAVDENGRPVPFKRTFAGDQMDAIEVRLHNQTSRIA